MLICSPLSSEYDSSQGPDKKRTVYQMALSKKSLSPLMSYCKRVLLNLEGTGGCSLKSSFSCLWLVLCSLSTSRRFFSALPVLCLCFRQTGWNLGCCPTHHYIRQPGPEGSWRQEGPEQEYCSQCLQWGTLGNGRDWSGYYHNLWYWWPLLSSAG